MPANLTPKEYVDKLLQIEGALPAVYAATTTRLAVAAEGAQRRGLAKDFTIRNKWTMGSIKTWKAKPLANADKINAVTGTISGYLATQETGGLEVGKDGKPTKTTPSAASRGKNWKRPLMARFRWKAIDIGTRWNGKKGDVFVLKPRSGNAVISKKRQSKRRALSQEIMVRRTGKRAVRRVRIINNGNVYLRAKHWHERAMAPLLKPALMQAAFNDEAKKALARLGARDVS